MADATDLPPDAARAACDVGLAAGLVAVGIARAEPFVGTRVDLETRREAGLHGGMAFTYRRPERSSDPTGALPEARSLVVGAWAYPVRVAPPEGGVDHAGPDDHDVVDQPDGPTVPAPLARVARYATDDHYGELRRALDAVADHLRGEGWRTRVLVDDNALVDREAAQRAGLGWYGKSANLLVPGHGPWIVLGSVLTDAPLPPTADRVPDGCGPCRRCLEGCPTGAIVADGVVDARRCLSWRLQDTGTFPRHLRVALGDRIYGCDECLEVCPPGRRVAGTRSVAVAAPRRAPGGSTGGGPAPDRVEVLAMLAASDEALLERYGRWYVPRRDPQYLRRNALVVLGNVGDPSHPGVRDAVAAHLGDPRPVVRAHAVWCARRLGFDDLWPALADDPDDDVRDEVHAEVPVRRVVGSGPGSVAVQSRPDRAPRSPRV